MKIKTVGIIGGLGPETTSKFYMDIILSCQQRYELHRPPVLIYSVPIRYKDELLELGSGIVSNRVANLLTDGAKKLEKAGANIIVMPCNSLHVFIEKIKESANVPVLNIIEETVKYLETEKASSVGLISSIITRNAKLYENTLASSNIECILPSDQEQTQVNRMIIGLVRGEYGNKERQILQMIIKNLKSRGAESMLLACTDLQLVMPDKPILKIFDTMKILAEATVRNII